MFAYAHYRLQHHCGYLKWLMFVKNTIEIVSVIIFIHQFVAIWFLGSVSAGDEVTGFLSSKVCNQRFDVFWLTVTGSTKKTDLWVGHREERWSRHLWIRILLNVLTAAEIFRFSKPHLCLICFVRIWWKRLPYGFAGHLQSFCRCHRCVMFGSIETCDILRIQTNQSMNDNEKNTQIFFSVWQSLSKRYERVLWYLRTPNTLDLVHVISRTDDFVINSDVSR